VVNRRLVWPAVTVLGALALAPASWSSRANAPASVSAARKCLAPAGLSGKSRPAKSAGEGTFSVFLGANMAELDFWASPSQAKAHLTSLEANPSFRGIVNLFRVANVVVFWPTPLPPSDPLAQTGQQRCRRTTAAS
jgi:hypothetical protein